MLGGGKLACELRSFLLLPPLIANALRAGSSVELNTVDIFNATSGIWTTAALSVARCFLAATSLPNDGLAIFAGGGGALRVLKSFIAGVGACVRAFWRAMKFVFAAAAHC